MIIATASKNLFTTLYNDAGNWGGNTLIDISKSERGNLTSLKKLGLLTTFNDDGCQFVQFTQTGLDFARSLDLQKPNW